MKGSQIIIQFCKNFIIAVQTRSLKKGYSSVKREFITAIHNQKPQLFLIKTKQNLKSGLKSGRERTILAFGIAKRNVTRSKYRSTLLIFGIILTIALETGIVVAIDTLYDDFIFDNRNHNFTDISVIPKKWQNLSTLQSNAREIRKIPGVSKASPVYSITARSLSIGEQVSAKILIYGIDPKYHPDFSSLNITEGSRKLSGTTLIVSQTLFDDSGREIGDIIDTSEFNLDLISEEFSIGGVIADPSFIGNNGGFLFILIDIEKLYEITPENRRKSLLTAEIDVSVENLLEIKFVTEDVSDRVGLDFFVWAEKDISEIEATGIRSYQTAMNLVIISSFVVEFLFITNILAIAIRDRSKEFGILRAVGTDSRHLIEAIAAEILIYSIIGSVIGIFVGIGFATLLVFLMQNFYQALSIRSMSLNPLSLMAVFSSGIIVSLISGLYPIFLAISMPVVQNIHSRMRSGKARDNVVYWKYTITMGVLLAITGFALQFFVGPSRFLDFEVLSVHFFVVVLIFLGTLLIEVGILVLLPKIGYKVLTLFFGQVTRTISMRNIAREFQKSLFTIMTSALALTFIIVVGLISAAVIAGVPVYFQEQWGVIDLVAEARDNNLPSITLTESLDNNDRITSSSFIQEERTKIEGEDGYVFGVDPFKYAHFAESVIVNMNSSIPSFMHLNQTEVNNGLNNSVNTTYGLISDLLFQKILSPLGSNVTIKNSENSTVNITIAAVIKSNVFLGNGEYLYISTWRFQEFFNSTRAKWFVCDVKGDVGTAQVTIENAYPVFKSVMGIDFYTKAIEKSLNFQSGFFQILFIESFILAGIAQFVCILVSTLRMEREMGIMRAVGLRRLGVFDIFMSESVALGFSALIIGVFDGLLGSILLAWYIGLSIPIVVNFPIDRIFLWVLASFLITLASTVLPSFRSSRKSIVATISGRPFRREYREKEVFPLMQMYYPPSSQKLIQEQEISDLQKGMQFSYLSSTSLWKFIKSHSLQIQTCFLVLMAITTLNYIIDGSIIIRGLNPFDVIWRLYYLAIGSSLPLEPLNSELIYGQYVDFFLIINPILFFIGLVIVGPFAYYFVHQNVQRRLVTIALKSLIWGAVGVTLCFLIPILVLIPAFLFLDILNQSVEVINFSQSSIIIYSLITFVIIIGLELLMFQKLWIFLIVQGLIPNSSFREKISLVRKRGSYGQVKFIGLLLIHIIIQNWLFVLSQPFSENFFLTYDLSYLPPVDPLVFLVLTTFEIGFFILLLAYQILQLQNQSFLLVPHSVDTSSSTTRITAIQDKGRESPYSSKTKSN